MSASLDLLHSYGLRPQRPEVIDSSMLKDYVDCQSRFYLRHILGLKKKRRFPGEDGKFDWGTLYHKAQEILWKQNDITPALQWIDQNFPSTIDPTTDKHKRSKDRMLQQFIEYYQKNYQELSDDYELLRLEQFFDIYDERIGLRWAGRIDKIRKRRRNGKVVVWDYKTASVMGSNYFNQHEYGFQFPGYTWAANRLFTEPVEEICLDVMYTLAGSHDFFRRTFRYGPAALREWEENVKLIVDEMSYKMDNFLDQPDKWTKNWNDCTSYGLCSFADVHFTPPTGVSRLRILSDDYIEDRWDPLNHSEESEAAL